jgi:hypothetical protein
MLIRYFIFTALMFVSTPGHSLDLPDQSQSYPWGSKGEPMAANAEVVSVDPKMGRGIFGRIRHDNYGEQTVAFAIITNIPGEFCNIEDNNGTAKLNGQPIRFYLQCRIAQGGEASGVVLLPLTQEGKNFVVNTLKNAKSDEVTLEHRDIKYNLPTTGFAQEWENAGGDAL